MEDYSVETTVSLHTVREIWKEVKGCENILYEVSDHGNVRARLNYINKKNNQPKYRQVFVYRNNKDNIAPYIVCMSKYKNNKKKRLTVRGLVARAFLGPRPTGYIVANKDEQVENCHLNNICYKPLPNYKK